MDELLTLKEFLDNPMGKGSTAIPNKELIKSDLVRRYEKLKKDIKVKVYKDKKDFYFHVTIPSESDRNNTYDVVIQFIPDADAINIGKTIEKYGVKFFSNCPSFVYTFAYVFNSYGYFIESLADKYDDKVLEDMPVVRNPNEIISFEKSIYFAGLYIRDKYKLATAMVLTQISQNYNTKVFNSSIRNSQKIQVEIKREMNVLKNKKNETKKKPAISKMKDIVKTVGRGSIQKIKPKPKLRTGRKKIK